LPCASETQPPHAGRDTRNREVATWLTC
jgi:hypothetical protein